MRLDGIQGMTGTTAREGGRLRRPNSPYNLCSGARSGCF